MKNSCIVDYNICEDCGDWHRPLCRDMCAFCMERETGGGICGPCAGFTEDGIPLDEQRLLDEQADEIEFEREQISIRESYG